MRWQTLQAQLERALATSEATLSLLREQLSEERQRRLSDREQLTLLILKDSEGTSAYMQSLHALTMSKLTELGEKIDLLHEQAGVPTRDIPTVEELLDQARTDDSKRKLLQNALAELEFENTEVDFN